VAQCRAEPRDVVIAVDEADMGLLAKVIDDLVARGPPGPRGRRRYEFLDREVRTRAAGEME